MSSPSPFSKEQTTALVFRVFTSLIFIVAGAQHLARPDAVAARLVAAPFGHWAVAVAPAHLLVLLTGGALLGGGLALLAGLGTRFAAALLMATLVPITVTVQLGGESLGPLFKNVAIFGALLHFVVTGGGRLSADAWLSVKTSRLALAAGLTSALLLSLVPAVGWTKAVAPTTDATGEKSASAHRVLFLVQQPSPVRAAMQTGLQLLEGELFPAREVEVLVCGSGVDSLVVGEPNAALATEASSKGLRVVACGLSLTQKKVDRTQLAPGVVVVENGFVEALERKAEGFLSVEL